MAKDGEHPAEPLAQVTFLENLLFLFEIQRQVAGYVLTQMVAVAA